MSMSNTRLRRCAQVIAARRSAGVVWSVSAAAWPLAPLPRLALVSCARCALFGANTPWKRVRLMRGLGTSAASVRHLCFELPFRLLPELVHRLFQLMQALRDEHVRGALRVGRLQWVAHQAPGGERQARLRHRPAADVPAQPLELFAFIGPRRHAGVQTEAADLACRRTGSLIAGGQAARA